MTSIQERLAHITARVVGAVRAGDASRAAILAVAREALVSTERHVRSSAIVPLDRVIEPNSEETTMSFIEPSTPLALDGLESVCNTGHVHNKHLEYCPWCLEGHGPGYQLIDPSTEIRS